METIAHPASDSIPPVFEAQTLVYIWFILEFWSLYADPFSRVKIA